MSRKDERLEETKMYDDAVKFMIERVRRANTDVGVPLVSSEMAAIIGYLSTLSIVNGLIREKNTEHLRVVGEYEAQKVKQDRIDYDERCRLQARINTLEEELHYDRLRLAAAEKVIEFADSIIYQEFGSTAKYQDWEQKAREYLSKGEVKNG